jgi:4-hydroxyphenylpyruvate dioxygenase-like putative hemolysin
MNNNTTEPATGTIQETANYLQISFSRAPKKNHDALARLGTQLVQWLDKHGVSSKIYYLNNNNNNNNNSSTTNTEVYEGLESIAKIISTSDAEELGVSLQFYRDQAHADPVRSKMMQDETFAPIGNEFDSLVCKGKA